MKTPVVDYRTFRLSKLNTPEFCHLKLLAGWVIYFAMYFITEALIRPENCHVVHHWLDDVIPFCEWFVIPYFLWFAYIAVTVVYFFFTNKRDFVRLCIFLFAGMTICLGIYYIWPNGQNLRPDLTTLGRENIFTKALAGLYTTDTSTNVCPSIHVLNSVACCIAIFKSKALQNKKLLRGGVLVLTISICLSTVFLKQHSVVDVFWGLVLSAAMYLLAYLPKLERIPEQLRKTSTT